MRQAKQRKADVPRVAPARAIKLWGPSVTLNLDGATDEAQEGVDLARALVRLADQGQQACERGEPPGVDAWREIRAIGHAIGRVSTDSQRSVDNASVVFGVVQRGGWQ